MSSGYDGTNHGFITRVWNVIKTTIPTKIPNTELYQCILWICPLGSLWIRLDPLGTLVEIRAKRNWDQIMQEKTVPTLIHFIITIQICTTRTGNRACAHQIKTKQRDITMKKSDCITCTALIHKGNRIETLTDHVSRLKSPTSFDSPS